MSGSPTLGLVCNTRNEERHLAAMLQSAAGCDEIVVADMESSDGTVELARRHGAKIVPLPNAGCCEPGRQAAIDAATCDWILLLDADERLLPGAVELLRRRAAAAPADVGAFQLFFDTLLGETRIVASGWEPAYEQHVRLFRRGCVTWPARVHAVPAVTGRTVVIPREETRIVHHNFQDLEAFLHKMNRYTSIEAQQLLERREPPGVLMGLRAGIDEVGRRYSPERDGAMSVALSLGLLGYRLFAQAKASERLGWPAERIPSRAAMTRGLAALWGEIGGELVEARPEGAASGNERSPADEGRPSAASGEPGGAPRPVSIVIPVHDKVAYTRNCLEWLARNTPGELFEVVIVDDASTDETPALLAALQGDVKVVTNAENLGFVGSCNAGAAAASGKYLLFLNNDTAPQENWLPPLLELVESDPEIGAVGCRLVYPDGKLQEAGGLIFSDGTGWNFGRGDDPFRPQYDRACEVDYCSGAALLVRREVFEQLGGFDRRYAPAYYEDTDLCFGVRSLGKKVVYCPRSFVVHHEGVSNGTQTTGGYKRYQELNRPKFVEKWREALAAHEQSPAVTGRAPVTADRALRLARRAPVTPVGGGPAILVVDPMMPAFDRASGSRRLFELLFLLRNLDARITYIARNGTGQERYEQALNALGIETFRGDPDRMAACGCRLDGVPRVDLPQLLQRRRFDLAWLSFWYVAEQYLPEIRLHSPGTHVLTDSVDIHFLRELREADLRRDGQARRAALETKRRELKAYRQSDTVVTVTAADAAVLEEAGITRPRVVVPNVHASCAGAVPGFEERGGILFVGNFAHPPNADAVRWFHADVFPRVRERLPDARLFVVGNAPPPEIGALAAPDVVVTGWVPSTERYLDACRVSIAPIRYGAGMKGKIGEALGRGLPVVTTSCGAEGMELVSGESALIADDPAAFADAVVRLHRDGELWGRLAAAGRAHVDTRYGPAKVREELARLLARVTGSPRALSA